MQYNNTKTSAGQVMPLLMGCTIPTLIEAEEVEHKVIYDPVSQTVVMDLRVVGTKCLKTGSTRPGRNAKEKTDKKNEIDDSKQV